MEPGAASERTQRAPSASARSGDDEATLAVLKRAAETLGGEGWGEAGREERRAAAAALWQSAPLQGAWQSVPALGSQRPLPPGWRQLWSKSQQQPYYQHKATRHCVWQAPDASSPVPDPSVCICRKCHMARTPASGSPEKSSGSTHGSPDTVTGKTPLSPQAGNGTGGRGLEGMGNEPVDAPARGAGRCLPTCVLAADAGPGNVEPRTGTLRDEGEQEGAADVSELHKPAAHTGEDKLLMVPASPSAATGCRETSPAGPACEPVRAARPWAPSSISSSSFSSEGLSTDSGAEAEEDSTDAHECAAVGGTARDESQTCLYTSDSLDVRSPPDAVDKAREITSSLQKRLSGGQLPHVTRLGDHARFVSHDLQLEEEEQTVDEERMQPQDAEISKTELDTSNPGGSAQLPCPWPGTLGQDEHRETVGQDGGVGERLRPAPKQMEIAVPGRNNGFPWLHTRQEAPPTRPHAESAHQHPHSEDSDETDSHTHGHVHYEPALHNLGQPTCNDQPHKQELGKERQQDAEISKTELDTSNPGGSAQYPCPWPGTLGQDEHHETVGQDGGVGERLRPAPKQMETAVPGRNNGFPWLHTRQEAPPTRPHAESAHQHPREGHSEDSGETGSHTHGHGQSELDVMLGTSRARWAHLKSSPNRFPWPRYHAQEEREPRCHAQEEHEHGTDGEQAADENRVGKQGFPLRLQDLGVVEALFSGGDSHTAGIGHLTEPASPPKPILQQVKRESARV